MSAGAGFSYGLDNKDTFQGTAEQFWTALQILFGTQEFAAFRDRRLLDLLGCLKGCTTHTGSPRLILATESFGARLGPILVRYSNDQNERIDRHEVTGYKLVFSAIMVNKYVLRGSLSFWFVHLMFMKVEPTTQWRKWIPWSNSRPALQGTEESKMGQSWIKWRNIWKLRGAVATCCGNVRKKGRYSRETKHVVMLGQLASVSIQI